MIKNPQRKHTKTMLPEDAKAFEYLSWDKDQRRCYLSKKTRIRYITLKGPLEGHVQELKESYWSLILPEDCIGTPPREVSLKQIGKGHSTIAYMGDDGWVWLVVSHKARDPAKDVLSEFNCEHEEYCKHIPYIEQVGFIRKRGSTQEDYVYRMAFYRTINASDKVAWKQLKELNKLNEKAFESTLKRHKYRYTGRIDCSGDREREMCNTLTDLVSHSTILPESLRQAVVELKEHLEDYDEGWVFEFPTRNIGIDEDGNLVLRDVIFNHIELQKGRAVKNRVY
jgi:hypothetical protein